MASCEWFTGCSNEEDVVATQDYGNLCKKHRDEIEERVGEVDILELEREHPPELYPHYYPRFRS